LEAGGLNIPGVERVPTTNDESPTKILCLTEVILLSIICTILLLTKILDIELFHRFGFLSVSYAPFFSPHFHFIIITMVVKNLILLTHAGL
jgi:hypothetical protein